MKTIMDLWGWTMPEWAAILGLTVSAAILAVVAFWLYERECDRAEEHWKLHVRQIATRQEWHRHPVDRPDWRVPSERVV